MAQNFSHVHSPSVHIPTSYCIFFVCVSIIFVFLFCILFSQTFLHFSPTVFVRSENFGYQYCFVHIYHIVFKEFNLFSKDYYKNPKFLLNLAILLYISSSILSLNVTVLAKYLNKYWSALN